MPDSVGYSHMGPDEPSTSTTRARGPGEIRSPRRRPKADNPVFNDNDLKLGMFATNCAHGGSVTAAERSFEPSMAHNVELAARADEIGFEMLTPLARWKGLGGSIDFNGQSMESITWAATVAQHTDSAAVFATVHVPMMHPLVVAKQAATIDHASDGRFALNVVSGWFRAETEMFDVDILEHDRRYDRTHEWTELLKLAWTEQGFDYDGEFYRIEPDRELAASMRGDYTAGGYMSPKPVQSPHPPMMNAGSSEAGREFAARHADLAFTPLFDPAEIAGTVDNYRDRARSHGRDPADLQVMSNGLCVVKPTQAEAEATYDRILADADEDAAHNLMDQIGIECETFDPDTFDRIAERFVAGYGGYPIVGDPETVADELVAISDAGLAGMLLIFFDYRESLDLFADEVLPMLEAAGVREASGSTAE